MLYMRGRGIQEGWVCTGGVGVNRRVRILINKAYNTKCIKCGRAFYFCVLAGWCKGPGFDSPCGEIIFSHIYSQN